MTSEDFKCCLGQFRHSDLLCWLIMITDITICDIYIFITDCDSIHLANGLELLLCSIGNSQEGVEHT